MRRRFAGSARWATASLIILAPQLMGGAFAWCVPVICAAALVCLGLALAQSRVREDATPDVLWAGVAATLWTGAQLIPLGTSWLSPLSPDRATSIRLLAAALHGRAPLSATAITYDPGATQLELLKGCSLLCAFIACYVLARRGHGRMLLTAVSISGALMALVALGHRAVDARSIFGLYRWQYVSPRLPAPILNDNSLAGFLVLTAPVALGLAISSPDTRARVGHYLAAFTIAATGLLTGSRAGTGAMVFGLLAMVALGRVRNRVRQQRWQQASLTAAIVAGALAVAVVIGAEPLFQTLNSDDFSKFDLIQSGLRLAFEHPWLGVGRGAFSAAMAPTMSDAGRFVHAENFVATWSSEWGFPVAAAVIVSVSIALWRLGLRRSSMRVGPAIALVAFAAQNLFDLGFELIGIAVVAGASLATAMGDLDVDSPAEPLLKLNLARVGRFVAGVTALSLVLWSAAAVADGDDAFERRLETHRIARSRTSFRHELERAVAAHPLEPTLLMLAGREAVDHRDPTALRWLNLVMLRSPKWSAPHVEATRLLLALGHPRQAALEAREAAKRNPGNGANAACAVARVDPNPELVMLAASSAQPSDQAQRFFNQLFRCIDANLARKVDQLLLKDDAPIRGPLLREYQRLVAEREGPAALRLLEGAALKPQPDSQILLAYVRALLGAKDTKAASLQLQRARAIGAPMNTVATLTAELATEQGDVAGMRAAIDQLRAASASSGEGLANAALLLARLEERFGNVGAAELALEDAAMLAPSPSVLRSQLSFAVRHGKSAKAQRVKSTLCALSPTEPACKAPGR